MIENNFWKRYGIFILFILAIAYIGIILAVALHEIVGHCLFMEMFGGQCTEITLKIDGMGWVSLGAESMSTLGYLMTFSAGALMTTLFGIIFIILAWNFRKKFFASLTFLILSVSSLLDGAPYFFWNSLVPRLPGDVARILELSPVLKLPLLIIGGLIMIAGIFALNYILFREGNAWLSKGKDLVGFQRWFLILTIFVAQVAAGFAFDWNQIIEGIGQIPNIVGTVITALFLVGIGLRVHNKKDNYEKSAKSWKRPMIIAWAALLITILLIVFIFQNGIKL